MGGIAVAPFRFCDAGCVCVFNVTCSTRRLAEIGYSASGVLFPYEDSGYALTAAALQHGLSVPLKSIAGTAGCSCVVCK